MVNCVFIFIVLILNLFSPERATGSGNYSQQNKVKNERVHLKQGINLSVWWENGKREDLKRENFENLKTLGFTFVRVPVAPQYLDEDSWDSQQKNLNNLRYNVIELLNNDIEVVLDLHPTQKFHHNLGEKDSDAQFYQLFSLWKKLKFVTNGLPEEKIYLQLLNEPTWKIKNWWSLQERLILNLRLLYPKNTFIASAYYSSWKRLDKECPYDDKNIIYDFHFYRPHFFTHHGIDWGEFPSDPREKLDNIQYPVSYSMLLNVDKNYEKMHKYISEGWNKKKIKDDIQPNVDWANKHGLQLVCLEFGVFKPYVDNASRARWITDVREILEELNVPWALWNYDGHVFGIVDSHGEIDEEILYSLGLRPSGKYQFLNGNGQ